MDAVELTSVIDDEHKRDFEPNNDIFLNKFSPLGFSDRSRRLGFYPLGEVVYGHYEELLLCCRHGKWVEDVDSPLGEGPWCGDGC